uniref:Uncharacterized protein n=1 Tax=Oryza glumipatula TaxID=40148 RepID=A0A0E0A4C8_9ORYZ
MQIQMSKNHTMSPQETECSWDAGSGTGTLILSFNCSDSKKPRVILHHFMDCNPLINIKRPNGKENVLLTVS